MILVVRTAVEPFSSFGGDALEWLSVLALLTVPLSFLGGPLAQPAGALGGRGARGGARRRAGAGKAPGRARARSRRPSLELAYWLRDDTFVDLDGRVVALPADGSGRVATVVERSGGAWPPSSMMPRFATIPNSLTPSVAAAGLALENGRLQADLRARLEDLRASRARLVETAETERRRLERNLHDGAQQRWSRCCSRWRWPKRSSHPTLQRATCSSDGVRSSQRPSASCASSHVGSIPPS